jgi:hypothetical protein
MPSTMAHKFAEAQCYVCGQGRCALCGDTCKSCAAIEREAERLYYAGQKPSALLPWGYECFSWRAVSAGSIGLAMRAKAKARLAKRVGGNA